MRDGKKQLDKCVPGNFLESLKSSLLTIQLIFSPKFFVLNFAIVGVIFSLSSFQCLMTFRASDFPTEKPLLCSPRVSIKLLFFSVKTGARHLSFSCYEQIQFFHFLHLAEKHWTHIAYNYSKDN